MKQTFLLILVFLTGMSLESTAQLSAQPSFSTFHGCEKRCGIYPVQEAPLFGDVKWKFQTKGKVFSSPAIHGGTAYIGSEDKKLYAIDTESGEQKWKFKTEGAVHSSPAYFQDVVYFGSFDGHYYAVDARTGKEKWRFKTGGEKWMGGKGYWGMKPADKHMNDLWQYYLSSPILDAKEQGLTLFFGSSDGHLYALNAETGELKWKYKTEGVIHTSPALYNGKVYFGSWDTYMYALDAASGKEIWKFKTGDKLGMSGIQSSPAIEEGKVYFGARDGFFYALNAETGDVQWQYNAEGSWILSTAGIKDGVLYVGTSDSHLLLALDAQSGEERFRLKANGYIFSSPAIVGNTAFFGDLSGQLFSVDLLKGKSQDTFQTDGRQKEGPKILTAEGDLSFMKLAAGKDLSYYSENLKLMESLYSLGSIVSSPAVGEKVIYFGSTDGYLYAVNLKGEAEARVPDTQAHEHP